MFDNRTQAGRILGRLVSENLTDPSSVVLALPRGGVPVAFEVAKAIHAAALDVFLVRKLGVPGQEELAFGAVATGGIRVLNRGLLSEIGISPLTIERVIEREQAELERRERLYLEGRPGVDVQSRAVILVDDGLATGATMLAAVQAVRLRNPKHVTVAVPVASRDAERQIEAIADRVICIETPRRFTAVGAWYEDFNQVTDDEVREILARFAGVAPAS